MYRSITNDNISNHDGTCQDEDTYEQMVPYAQSHDRDIHVPYLPYIRRHGGVRDGGDGVHDDV